MPAAIAATAKTATEKVRVNDCMMLPFMDGFGGSASKRGRLLLIFIFKFKRGNADASVGKRSNCL
jgi:hypothetical protein